MGVQVQSVPLTENEQLAYDRALDVNDDCFCGIATLHSVDSDGHPKMLKGSHIEANLYIERDVQNNCVQLTAELPALNPLFYFEIRQDESFLIGNLRFGGDDIEIGKIIPADSHDLHKELEKTGEMKASLQLNGVRQSAKKLCEVQVSTSVYKLKTVVTQLQVSIPMECWDELKVHRLKWWRQKKNLDQVKCEK